MPKPSPKASKKHLARRYAIRRFVSYARSVSSFRRRVPRKASKAPLVAPRRGPHPYPLPGGASKNTSSEIGGFWWICYAHTLCISLQFRRYEASGGGEIRTHDSQS